MEKELNIKRIEIIPLQIKTVSLIHKLRTKDYEGCEQIANELMNLIEVQIKLKDEWTSLLFQLANKL